MTNAATPNDTEKQLNDILVGFKIGELDIRMTRYKISKLFNNEEIVKPNHNIADEKWEEL